MKTNSSPPADEPRVSRRTRSPFSLLNLRIRYRLPLLIGVLVFLIVAAPIWASYRGVRESALEVGRARLTNLTQLLANQTQQGLPIALNNTFTVANDPAIRNLLIAPSSGSRTKAMSV